MRVNNSCSVTEHADQKCRNLIRNPLLVIPPGAIIVGLLTQLKPQKIAAIEGVDIVLSNDKGALYKRWLSCPARGAQVYSCDTDSLTSFFRSFERRLHALSSRVQDGRLQCAYCTIHYVRGSCNNA